MQLVTDLTDKQIKSHLKNIDYYGYTTIGSFLKDDAVSHLLKLINNQYNEINSKGKVSYAGVPDRNENDKMLYSIYNINKCFIDLLTSKTIRKIGMHKLNDDYYRFLPEDVPNYILNYYNARSSGDKLDLHIDSYIPFISYQKTNAIQCVFLLEDSFVENGCTVVVPGSHKSANYTDRDFFNYSKPITGKAGDLIIWDSRLWHGTMENISKRSRWALVATLTQWWCKQSMDIVRNVKNDIYLKCTDEQKQLLGFCSIPPVDEFERNNTKTGYDYLKKNVHDYF